MSDTDDIVIRLNEQAAVMLAWANRHRILKLDGMQSVFQKAGETMMDAAEYVRLLDDQHQTSARGLAVYRTVASDLNDELERVEKYSIGYNVARVFRIIRNFYQ